MQIKYIVKFLNLILCLSTISIAATIVDTSNLDVHSSLEDNFSIKANKNNIKWSILIPTIEDRKLVFQQLHAVLIQQITALNLADKIEIIYFRDKRNEHTVGFKRNVLLEKSLGEYVCFIDDDDSVHVNYIQMIYKELLKNPDCISLVGIITTNGKDRRTFIHSVEYTSLFNKDGIAYRPPNHLNPIKRSIAIQFKFPLKNVGEDTNWAMQICHSKLIKTEIKITEPYYFYNYNYSDSVQFQHLYKAFANHILKYPEI